MSQDKNFYLIGEVSKTCKIPIKTLRYYDEIGLLKPVKVDDINNYRYYSKEQMLSVNIIKDLKVIGFSLKEIKSLLKREDIAITIENLKMKLQETNEKINELECLSRKISSYIHLLHTGSDLLNQTVVQMTQNYNIELKQIPKYSVVYTRYCCPCNPGAFIVRYSQLNNLIEKHHLHRVGSLQAIFHDHYTKFNPENADIEILTPIIEKNEIPHVTKLYGGYLAATTMHRGSYRNNIEAYKALMDFIENKGYELSGPALENYIIDSGSTSYEENYITEIILPITKK